jgi:hypothetical protein
MRKRLRTHEKTEFMLRSKQGLSYGKAHDLALKKEHEGLNPKGISTYEGKLGSIARHRPARR